MRELSMKKIASASSNSKPLWTGKKGPIGLDPRGPEVLRFRLITPPPQSDEDKQLVAGQRDKLQGQYLDSQREITRLEALNAEKDMRMEVLQHELGTTQALTQSVHPLREELQALQDDRAGLERKLAQRQQDAAQLRVAVETRVHGMKEKMVLLQDDINRLTGENATLQVRIAAMREPDSPLFSSHAAAVRP
eukprot:TRINITY_DN49362_c0_g1_i1.p1 TRINITY_DN49362_c0_g1~~TRINITY_DN49362_c0_g1_i1.p1  ORF type:complete len:192 (+),score=39.75 TRINITY_DN49362_c0_g1_i1:49-624(+)